MLSPGIRNPERNLIICVVVSLLSWSSIAWGIYEMHATGQETPGSGLKIGLAILPAIMAPLLAVNFWNAVKVFARMRRGDNQIARWSVTPADLVEFAAANKARNARGVDYLNDWSPPREPPASGIEVIFAADAVLAHDTYFSLANTGLFRFSGVEMIIEGPPVIAFRTATTYANRFGLRTTNGELRIPVSPRAGAEVARVVAHFEQVLAGKVIANPGFYGRRVRIGLIGAPVFFAIAAVGFVLGHDDLSSGSVSIASLMAISGLVFGIASLVLALAAMLLGRAQLRKR